MAGAARLLKTESGDSGLSKVFIFNLFLLITKLGYEATSRLVSKRIFGRTNSLVFMISINQFSLLGPYPQTNFELHHVTKKKKS